MSRPTHGGNLGWAAAVAACLPHEVTDFSASISPLGPPPSVLAAIDRQLVQQLSHYPDPSYHQLRQVVASYHGVDVAWIMPGNGAAELLTWAGRDLAQLDRCFYLSPGFADYRRATASYGCSLEPIQLLPSKAWQQGSLVQPTADSLQRSVLHHISHKSVVSSEERPAQRLGIIINSPHNPSGQLIPKDFIRFCLQRFELVVVDEAFMDFLSDEDDHSVVSWLKNFDNLVVLRSLTKFYSLPGLRVGYALAHPERLRRWQQWRDPWSVNNLAAVAAAAAIADQAFQRLTWQWLESARDGLYNALKELPTLQPWPSCANFLLVRYGGSVAQLQRQLLEQHRLYIRDCQSFAQLGDRYFRIAVRTDADNQALVQALRQLAS